MGQHDRSYSGRTAFVTGICGQIGSYLAEHLLSLGYSQVHGLVRPTSDVIAARERIECFADDPRVSLHYGDLCDQANLTRLLRKTQPDEIFNLAAQSHVRVSFDLPLATGDVTGLGALRLFEAVREACPDARVYQASSSELFGDSPPPQSETTPFSPRSPYAVAKLSAFYYAKNYRDAYGLHISNGILFNSESPRRGPNFVTRKITRGMARIALGKDKVLRLGNLDARRDWMHAKDAVRGMHLMLQQEQPDDYVLATGRSETVSDFMRLAFQCVGTTLSADYRVAMCRGKYHFSVGEQVTEIDPAYLRPTEVDHLCGDAAKARRVLGWQPQITLEELAKEMVETDLKREAGRA